jgi:hypothetical protein
VHRNALPLLAALSLLAAALAEAVGHLYAWMKATARALLAPALELAWAAVPFAPPPGRRSPAPLTPWARPRAPPLPA